MANLFLHSSLQLSIVSEMITPGILILASGSLINSTLLRLSRTVDRSRELMVSARQFREAADREQEAIHMRWLTAYAKRVNLVERALTTYYVAIFLFVASTLAIAINDLTHGSIGALAPGIVILGAVCLFGGTAALVVEANIATGTLRSEILTAFAEASPAARE